MDEVTLAYVNGHNKLVAVKAKLGIARLVARFDSRADHGIRVVDIYFLKVAHGATAEVSD